MKSFLKAPFFVVLLSGIYLIPGSQAALILKTKNKQALIHLEGIKTKRGSYFEVIDFYGEKRGLIQIKRVGETKAIGVAEFGNISKKWSLEPISEKRAVAQIKKRGRASKIARIQKEKLKRKLASKKKRQAKKKRLALKRKAAKKKRPALKRKLARKKRPALKRKLAKKKRAAKRAVAAYEEDSEYILNELPEEGAYQSQEVLSYGGSSPLVESEAGSSEDDKSQSMASNEGLYHETPRGPSRIFLGLAPRFEYNVVNVNPEGEVPPYLMHGLGYSVSAYFDFSLNNFIRTEGNLGFKQFSADSKGQDCGHREDCSLKISYVAASSNLKLNISKWNEHQFWGAFEGTLMYPIAYSNTTLVTDQGLDSRGAIGGPHGTIGGALGLDFTFGNLVFPISLRAGVYMPPTAEILIGTFSFQLGLAYKL